MRLGECIPCQSVGMPVMPGMRGLGAIVMEPLRGGLANGEVGAWDAIASSGPVAPVALMAGSAVSGGLIGGLSAGSWKGAGTGALLTSGLSGLGTGLAMLFVNDAAPAPEVAAAAGLNNLSSGGVRAIGAAYAALGAALLGWGGYRAYKAIKRR